MMARSGNRYSAGFSLVELMVGMLLGIMLLAGAASIYLVSKRSYTEVEQVASLSENGRFAVRIVTDALRHVGFFGHATGDDVEWNNPALGGVTADCTGVGAAYDVRNYLRAVRVPGGGGTMLGCVTDAKPLTDILVVKHVNPQPFWDADPNAPLAPRDGIISFPDTLPNISTFANNRAWVMTNHQGGRIFDDPNSPPSITTGGEFPGGTAWQYQLSIFYIRDTEPPMLSRKTLALVGGAMTVVTEDMVEGVENLRFMFGEDTGIDGEVDTYSNLTGVSDWSRVQSIEAFFIMRSATEDLQYTDPKTYTLGDLNWTPTDLNFRRLMLQTGISLRNPKLVIRGGA